MTTVAVSFKNPIYSTYTSTVGPITILDSIRNVEKDIKFWLPYIKMREIRVDTEADNNRVNFSFSFSVGETGANKIIIVGIDEQGGLSIA